MPEELSKEQKLKKIIERVVENGWESGLGYLTGTGQALINAGMNPYSIIFNPEFGKAFWKNQTGSTLELVMKGDNDDTLTGHYTYMWQYHQHQLLTEIQAGRDPIDYLYQFV